MTTVFFNEIHYENIGVDVNEGVEVAGPAGTSLDGWKVFIYDQKGNLMREVPLNGQLPNQQNNFGTLYFKVLLPNQTHGNGIALVDNTSKVRHFLSWKALIRPHDGLAAGLASEVIPIEENNKDTPVGASLQLTGKGHNYEDFKWTLSNQNTFGAVNTGQTFA